MDKKRLDKAARILDEYFAGTLSVELERRIRDWWAGEAYREEKDAALERLWDERVDFDRAPGGYALDSLERITRRLGFPEGERPVRTPTKKATLGRRTWMRVAAVAVPLLLIGGGAWIALTREPGAPVVLTADAGEQQQYTLPDGTRVWVNPDSRVAYTEPFRRRREVTVAGEAFFDVTPMEKKPFTVLSDALQVTVYGTQFMVTVPKDKDRATVTLHNGSVAVAAGQTETVLVPGEQIQYYPSTGEIRVEEVELEDWTKPSLDFYDASLEDIFRSVERNFGVTIHSGVPPPAQARYTVRFSARQSPDQVMRILERLVRTFDYTIDDDRIEIGFDED